MISFSPRVWSLPSRCALLPARGTETPLATCLLQRSFLRSSSSSSSESSISFLLCFAFFLHFCVKWCEFHGHERDGRKLLTAQLAATTRHSHRGPLLLLLHPHRRRQDRQAGNACSRRLGLAWLGCETGSERPRAGWFSIFIRRGTITFKTEN